MLGVRGIEQFLNSCDAKGLCVCGISGEKVSPVTRKGFLVLFLALAIHTSTHHRMAPPSSSSTKQRRYRHVGVQTGDTFPSHSTASCDVGTEFLAGGVDPTGDSEHSDATIFKQDRSSEATQDSDRYSGSDGANGLQPPIFSASRLFSLPSYLTDEALQQRLKAEGVVDDRDEELPERRVASISGIGARQATRGLDMLMAPLAPRRSSSADRSEQDGRENRASSSFTSTTSNATVIIHREPSERREVERPARERSLDRSSGSTPESIIIITARDSGTVHPGSFLRSRTSSPPTIQAPSRSPGLSRLALPPDAFTTEPHNQPRWVNWGHDTDKTGVTDTDGWVTTSSSPPRPIPALHGPSSLPYARCPS